MTSSKTIPTEMIEAGVKQWQADNANTLEEEIAAIYTAMEAAKPSTDAGGWQPIETAPREEFSRVILIARNTGTRCVMPALFDGEEWKSISLVGLMTFVEPTHWQPLPDPPATQADRLSLEGGA